MRVTILISKAMDGYLVGVLQLGEAPLSVWRQVYPSAEACISSLLEYELASIFDADDFRNSSVHTGGGTLIHYTETDVKTLKDAGFEEQPKAN